MYPKPKGTIGTKIANLFVTLCLLIFAGVIVVGIIISRDGGAGFKNLIEGSGDNPLNISK